MDLYSESEQKIKKKKDAFDRHSKMRSRLSSDLMLKSKKYKSESAFKRSFLESTSFSEKSYYRYRKAETTPNLENARLIYAFILDKKVNEISFSDLPEDIRKFFFSNTITDRKDLNELLNRSDVHREIYWLTSNNSILNLKHFSDYHGMQKITAAVNDLLSAKIIQFINDENITCTSIRASINSTHVLQCLDHLTKKSFRKEAADNSEKTNYCHFEIFNVSNEGSFEIDNAIFECVKKCSEIENKMPGKVKKSIGLINENLNLVFNIDSNNDREVIQ